MPSITCANIFAEIKFRNDALVHNTIFMITFG